MGGFYIDNNVFHSNTLLHDISTPFEEDLGTEADSQNQYAKGMGRNNSFYMAVKRNYRKGVIGLGFNIQSKTNIKYKAKGKKKKVKFDKEFEKIIRQWSKKGNCELTGRYFFSEAQRMMVDEYVTVGGFIIAHHSSREFEFGYKFEILPLSRIDTSKHEVLNGRTFNGIVTNAKGEITNIWLFKDSSNTQSTKVPYSKLTLTVNKLFDPLQYSGISPLVAIFEAMEYIDEYKGTQMEGASKRARAPMIIHTPMFTQMMEASLREEANRIKEETGKFEPIAPTYNHLNKIWQTLRLDGTKEFKDFVYVAKDESVTETGKSVDNIYEPMFKNEARSASAGVGLSASSTVGELASSYNAALKAGADEADEYQIVAQEISDGVLREMLEVYLLNAIVDKWLISPPDYWVAPSKYRNLLFLREIRRHIDPVKTAKALTEDIYVNKTLTMQKALGQKGVDYEEYLDEQDEWDKKLHKQQIKAEKRRLKDYKKLQKKYKKLGIDYATPIQQKVESSITEPDIGEQD